MDTTPSRTSLLLLAALALAGCPDRTAPIDVQLIPANAGGAGPDPMEGVTRLRVRFLNAARCGQPDANDERRCLVSGGGVCLQDADCGFGAKVFDKVVEASAHQLAFDGIPAGQPLMLEVAGLDADNVVASWGRSNTLLVPTEKKEGTPPLKATVFLRRVESFSPVTLASDPAERTVLTQPRAGHTATLLDDGRVLFAGGFDTAGTSKDNSTWKYTDGAEIFDPFTGVVTPVEGMNQMQKATPRAFHSAVKLSTNQVLISGGEYVAGGSRTLSTQPLTVIFDPSVEDPTKQWVPQPSRVSRSRHVALVEGGGKVHFFGGIEWSATTPNVPAYVQTHEWFDSAQNLFTRASPGGTDDFTALGHVGLPVYSGKYLVYVGGSRQPDKNKNEGALNSDRGIRFYWYKDEKIVEAMPVNLGVPRAYPAFAGQGARFLILGGFTQVGSGASCAPANENCYADLFPSAPHAGIDILNLKGPNNTVERLDNSLALRTPRGHACAVTLPDKRIVVIGGRGGKTGLGSVASTEIFTDDEGELPGAFSGSVGGDLEEGRYFHTCTLLSDGTVLVAGGVSESGGALATLTSMEIFVPRPPAD